MKKTIALSSTLISLSVLFVGLILSVGDSSLEDWFLSFITFLIIVTFFCMIWVFWILMKHSKTNENKENQEKQYN